MPGKGSGNIIGYKYYLGMHLAICKSADKLLNIVINNRVLFGSPQVTMGVYDPTITGKFPDKDGQDITGVDVWIISKTGLINKGMPPGVNGDMELYLLEGHILKLDMEQLNKIKKTKVNSASDATTWQDPFYWLSSSRENDGGVVTATQDIIINKEDLFGGDTREGGISGKLGIKFGDERALVATPSHLSADGFQAPDPYLEAQWGTDFTPAFRGIFSLIAKQMYIGVNPYLKNWEVLVQRTPCRGWYDAKATLLSTDGYEDTNPAHIIRELLVNHGNKTSWGLMYPESVVDDVQFKQSAYTLYDEGFGLSFSWDTQESTEVFINRITNHINGTVRANPLTGMIELKLHRHDHYLYHDIGLDEYYWVDSNGVPLLHFDESNCTLDDYQSVGWGETVNEVTVRYSQRWTGKAQSITVQDIANMQIQGQTISQTQDFLGITNGDLAARVAKMQLQVVSTPLNKIDITINRAGFSLLQGDVFQFSWAKKGIVKGFYRIGDITKGRVGDGKITVKAVLDVFSLPANTYVNPERIGWSTPDVQAVEAYNLKFLEQSYWDVVYSQGGATASSGDDGSSYLMGLAARPAKGMSTFEFYLDTTIEQVFDPPETRTVNHLLDSVGHFCPFVKTVGGVSQEISSTFTYTDDVDMDKVNVKAYGYLGNEVVRVTAIDNRVGFKSITVDRGMLDTVPVEHAADTKLFLYGTFTAKTGSYSSRTYSALSATEVSEDPDNPYYAKFLPSASSSKLMLADVSEVPYIAVGRVNLPYPVGNVKINGNRYPAQVSASGDLTITFSRRNGHQMTPTMELQSATHIGVDEDEVYYSIKVYYDNVWKRTVEFPYPNFTGLSTATTGVFTFLYTMTMQDTDLTGVPGYVSGTALAADTKIEIRAHRLADDEVTILDNYQTQTVSFRRDL